MTTATDPATENTGVDNMASKSRKASGGDNPFDRTVLLSLTVRLLGLMRKVDSDDVEVEADKSMLRISKAILECDEYDAILAQSRVIKDYLTKKCVPGVRLVKGGIYPIPVTLVEDVDEKLNELIVQFGGKVAKFVEVYEARAETARARLGVLANAKDYPPVHVVRRAFAVTYEYITLGPPSSLKDISGELWLRESAKIREKCSAAAEQVRDTMRGMFKDLVDHMVDRLTPSSDGTKKTFKGTLVPNFMEFLDSFGDRNVTNDGELAALVVQAKDMLDGKSTQSLRDQPDLRAAVREKMATIKASLDGIVKDKVRAINLDD